MSEKISRKEFLIRGATATIAFVGITACGRLFSADAFAAAEAVQVNVGEDKSLVTVDDLKTRGAVSFLYNGKKSILLYNGGEIRAFENICTHRGGPSKLFNGKLVCQWHGATFDPLTGESLKPPAPKGSKLVEIKVETRDGKIFLAA
jgi:nitrite reductase/ring-hydroxylating ferredoxin subunit